MELADVPRYRPLAFDKMESLIKEMQDPENGVPVRSQKLFLSVIPSAFTGYDLVEWLMERFNLDETSNVEAINLGNQLCQYGYFFPVNDLKNLVLKDDSSLYRFQSPYYWPWQAPRVAGGSSAPTLGPDNVEYAIYLVKRTLRNKQRHGLEDYEQEALANLKKNLSAKWDFITMQAEEQVRLAKERKKGDKIVSDSQERAYWRVARPPPGVPSALEPCPVPVRARHPRANKKRTVHQVKKEIEHLKASLDRTRVKTSIALEALMAYSETFAPYDPWLTPPQPSNPWVSDDTLFWQINSPLVDVPSEKRVQRWALSIEELVSDPTGLQEFTSFLRKEYSHENIRFWTAVMDLRRSSTKQIPKKLQEIYEEFLAPGAPCEINIDGATAERVSAEIRSGSRYALDHAAGHVYSLLLKKDCYPRFVRSDHFQRLLVEGKNVHQKKAKFFNFGGGQVKKKPAAGACGTSGAGLARRRGSDRSLSGSAHELALMGAARAAEPPAHAHSHSNLAEADDEALPWESAGPPRRRQDSAADSGSSSSDVSAVPAPPAAERARRLPQQSTLDGGLRGAPPPLRRLSAVEPRHLAPLASPPRPVPAPAPPPAPPPVPSAHHPTPTISVSSAPEEDSTHGSASPEEPRSLAVSDEPSSVFASTAATPTDPRLDGELSTGSESRSTLRADEDEAPASAEEPAPGELASTSRVGEVASGRLGEVASGEISGGRRDEVASGGRLEEIAPNGQLGEILSGRLHEVATSSRLAEIASGSQLREVSVCRLDEVASGSRLGEIAPDVRHDAIASGSGRGEIASGFRLDEVASCSRLDEVSSSVRHVEVASGSGAGEVAPGGRVDEVASGSRMGEVGSCAWLGEFASASIEEEVPTPPVAPLAVGEDIGAEDDPADKVPSPPPPPPPAPAPAHPASESDATKLIAHRDRHKDEVTSVSESSIVKRGGKGGGERAQRNDICPWEDENSCESDAPFVKTYATLGYL